MGGASDSLLWPAAARAVTGVPVRNERVRLWVGPAGVEFGVADRGVARDGLGDVEVEVGSRPVTGGFLAATVDMIDQQKGIGINVYLICQPGREGKKQGQVRKRAIYRESDL